jgi:CubicO group peptidase (beta-lactamase class C family)
MNNTWVHVPQDTASHTNITIGHNASGRMEKNTFADDVVGDKGVYSTVEDLFKWDQSLYTYKILKKETLDEAFKGYSNEHKGKRNYGFGWRLIETGKGNKIVYHNGWWHGYNSLFFRRPEDQTTIIILSNKDNRSTFQIQDILPIVNSNAIVEENFEQ